MRRGELGVARADRAARSSPGCRPASRAAPGSRRAPRRSGRVAAIIRDRSCAVRAAQRLADPREVAQQRPSSGASVRSPSAPPFAEAAGERVERARACSRARARRTRSAPGGTAPARSSARAGSCRRRRSSGALGLPGRSSTMKPPSRNTRGRMRAVASRWIGPAAVGDLHRRRRSCCPAPCSISTTLPTSTPAIAHRRALAQAVRALEDGVDAVAVDERHARVEGEVRDGGERERASRARRRTGAASTVVSRRGARLTPPPALPGCRGGLPISCASE